MDRNRKSIEVAKIKTEVPKNIEAFAGELWDLRQYKQAREKEIANRNSKYGMTGLLKTYKQNLLRVIDIEEQIKSGEVHEFIPGKEISVKTINMIISEAEEFKFRLKIDENDMKEMGIKQGDLNKVKEEALKGKDGYKFILLGDKK